MGNIFTYVFCIICYKKINTNCIKCSICNNVYHNICYYQYNRRKHIHTKSCPFCKNKNSLFDSTKDGNFITQEDIEVYKQHDISGGDTELTTVRRP